MIGIDPKNGTWSKLRPVLRVKIPPMTTVLPSGTSRSVSAWRLRIVGSPRADVWLKSGSSRLIRTCIAIEPSAVTCGFTTSASFASWNVV